jgi:hypothetical protein
MSLEFCNSCETAENFLTATLGTNTGLRLVPGGLNFLMLAKCDQDVSTLGTTLANWNTALINQANYRAIIGCFSSGSQTESNPSPPAKLGSCGIFATSKKPLDGTVNFVIREDNVSADRYKFFYALNGQQVKFVTGSCDNKTIYDWRTGLFVLSSTEIPESSEGDAYINYTIQIIYKSEGDAFDVVGQTWAISELVIP